MSESIETMVDRLPSHYTSRPLTLDDAEAVVILGDAANHAMGIDNKGNADVLRSDWQEPNFDLANSSIAIEDKGVLIGYAVLWDNDVTPVRPWSSWTIQHELYGTPLAGFILNWLETTARRVLDKVPADARVILQTNVLEGYQPRVEALNQAGFAHARNFYRMLITLNDAPPTPTLADNIIIRAMHYPDELEKMVKAVEEGFRDHWGFVEEPLEESLKFWTHYTQSDELFDPELYFLAIDTTTDTVAGVAMCRIEQYGKPEAAYVEEIAVIPTYRRQGIALAILQHIFAAAYARGKRQVALHVDADSLTGATRLYHKAGMQAVETWMNYAKVLRDGVELSTTSLE